MVTGDQTGEVMFYGKGAGKEATASAVVADIMDCIKHIDSRKYLSWDDGFDGYVETDSKSKSPLFVRITSENFETLETKFKAVFGDTIKNPVKNQYRNEIAFITEPILKTELKDKLSSLTDCNYKILHIL